MHIKIDALSLLNQSLVFNKQTELLLLNLKNMNIDLVELHEQLNEFSKHHQNLGGQDAHRLVKSIWDDVKTARISVEPNFEQNQIIDGFFELILSKIHQKFVP